MCSDKEKRLTLSLLFCVAAVEIICIHILLYLVRKLEKMASLLESPIYMIFPVDFAISYSSVVLCTKHVSKVILIMLITESNAAVIEVQLNKN